MGRDVGGRFIRIAGNDAHAKPGCSRCDRLCNRSERQQAQHASSQTIDWLAGLPEPDPGASCAVVITEPTCNGEQQGHRMIRNLVLAPVIGDVSDQDVASRGRVNVHNVHTRAVASNDPAAGKGIDRLRANRCILCDDGVCVSGDIDHIVLALALSGDQFKACILYDRSLDINIAVVVVSNHDGLFLILLHNVSRFLSWNEEMAPLLLRPMPTLSRYRP